jgi:homoserine O-acetyltransferase
MTIRLIFLTVTCVLWLQPFVVSAANNPTLPSEGEYKIQNFKFASGQILPELRLHYTTFGAPQTDSLGRVTNAVLIMHGTGGSGGDLIFEGFSGLLFRPGGVLDARRYYIILPDAIGHGKSSKPSDGLKGMFPNYGYKDMIDAQHELLTKGLKINHLRLVMGTSMGCMHSFQWAITYPDFMDAVMPLACLPVQIAGRNRVFRELAIQNIKDDPDYHDGDYQTQPRGIRVAAALTIIAASAPLRMQARLPTRDDADKFTEKALSTLLNELDANDYLYQLSASADYDPSSGLERIKAPLYLVNFADDFINPPELGIAEREIRRIKNGRYVLIPASDQTHGHSTCMYAEYWHRYLTELLERTAH